jgi:hypothetical protein
MHQAAGGRCTVGNCGPPSSDRTRRQAHLHRSADLVLVPVTRGGVNVAVAAPERPLDRIADLVVLGGLQQHGEGKRLELATNLTFHVPRPTEGIFISLLSTK